MGGEPRLKWYNSKDGKRRASIRVEYRISPYTLVIEVACMRQQEDRWPTGWNELIKSYRQSLYYYGNTESYRTDDMPEEELIEALHWCKRRFPEWPWDDYPEYEEEVKNYLDGVQSN